MTTNQSERGFAKNPKLAAEAGRKGGQMSGGNFKNNPQRASEAGRKGGQNSHGGGRQSQPS
jgi:general stress protein YciG